MPGAGGGPSGRRAVTRPPAAEREEHMGHTGYVQLYRRMLDQPWYQSPSARAVYLHLLLTVRYKPGAWRRIPLQPGQTVTSIRALSAALGLSPAAVRAGLQQLRACGAVTLTRRPDGSVYTLSGYEALCGGPPDAPALPLAAAAPPLDAVPPENLPATSAPPVNAGASQPCPAAPPAGPRRGRTSPGRPSEEVSGTPAPLPAALAPPVDMGASQPHPAAPPAGPRCGRTSPGRPSGDGPIVPGRSASASPVDAGASPLRPAAPPAVSRRGRTSLGQPSGDEPIVPGLSVSAPTVDAGASQPRPAALPAVSRRGQTSPGRPSGNARDASRLPAAAVSPVPSAALSDADRVDAQFCRVLADLAQTKGG